MYVLTYIYIALSSGLIKFERKRSFISKNMKEKIISIFKADFSKVDIWQVVKNINSCSNMEHNGFFFLSK